MSAVPKQQAFLKAFAATGSITMAAAAVGIDRSNHYQWLESDPAYEAAFATAVTEAAGFLEDTAIERATVGWEEPVIYQGMLAIDPNTGVPLTIRKRSDTLLQLALKAWLPKKYRENVHVDGNITHNGLSAFTDEELDRIARGGGGGAAEAAPVEEQNPELLPGDGAVKAGAVPEAPGVLSGGRKAPGKTVPRRKPRRKN